MDYSGSVEPEVVEELITPRKNRPWKYIPQFTENDCRMIRVERTREEEQEEEEEKIKRREEGEGLLQYYRHNRLLETVGPEEDMNGDLEVVELAKVLYGKPSQLAEERQEVQEEPIVPIRIVRRTEVEMNDGLMSVDRLDVADPERLGGESVGLDEPPIEAEKHHWKTFAIPSTHGEPTSGDGSEGRVLKATTMTSYPETGFSYQSAEYNIDAPAGFCDLETGDLDHVTGLASAEERQPRAEVEEEMLVETKVISQASGFPAFSYSEVNGEERREGGELLEITEPFATTEHLPEENMPLPITTRNGNPLPDITIDAEIAEISGKEELQAHGDALLEKEEEVKVTPGHHGGTLPPVGTKMPPAKPSRARRTKSETFFGFLRKRSKSREIEGEEKRNKELETNILKDAERKEEKGGKSQSAKTTPTTSRSKDVKITSSEVKKKPSFLQKLGFGRTSKKNEKQADDKKDPDKQEPKQEISKSAGGGDVIKSSSLPKQTAGKTNIRIFELMAKNHESPELNPDVNKSSVSHSAEVDNALDNSESKSTKNSEFPASQSRVNNLSRGYGSELGTSVAQEPSLSLSSSLPVTYPTPEGDVASEETTSRNVLYDEKRIEKERKDATPHGDDYVAVTGTLKSAAARDVNASSVEGIIANIKRNYIVAVAIDFGTAFSGYAFCFLRDPESIHMMGRWEDGDPGVINQKTPTTLLLTPDGEFHSFGFTARNNYHDLSGEEAKQWLYFDRYKMALYEAKDFSDAMTLEAANGSRFSGLDVISMTLRFFKDHALEQISNQSETRLLNDDVLWIVTVPAIWNASAKQFMRLAAYKAGLASPERPDQLQVALEPEAASVHIRRLQLRHLVPEKQVMRPLTVKEENVDPAELEFLASQFNSVVRYMVVDCGGGTVDITVHEMNFMTKQLQELHVATGGPHGSFSIDRDFERLLGEIFDPEFIQSYKTERPSGWIGLMMAFESRKRAADPRRTNPLNIALPFSFIEFHRKIKGFAVEEAIKSFEDSGVRWSSQGMLRLTQDKMKHLFSRTIINIKHSIENVLSSVKGIDYIFLVGGLSESSVLQTETREHFVDRVKKIVIPQEANLAVIKGALAFGLDPTVIAVRRSKLTYGAAVLNRFVHGKHPKSKLVSKEGVDWCRDVFDVFVSAGQVVRAGESVVRQYIPAASSQKQIVIGIYCTEDTHPGYVSDPGIRKCANVSLDLTTDYVPSATNTTVSGGASSRRRIQAELIFAETEIRVTATDTATGRKVNASIDFLNV